MPANNPAPQSFEIEALSPAGDPENDTYVLSMRLEGAYGVRAFLSAVGVDEKRIAFAIEELGRSQQVTVRNQPPRRRAA